MTWVMRKRQKGSVIGINGTTLLFPNNAPSSWTSWKYGIIHSVYIEAPPVAEQQVLIRNAANTITLASISLPTGGAHPGAYHVHIPIIEPWGVRLSAADGAASIAFEYVA